MLKNWEAQFEEICQVFPFVVTINFIIDIIIINYEFINYSI